MSNGSMTTIRLLPSLLTRIYADSRLRVSVAIARAIFSRFKTVATIIAAIVPYLWHVAVVAVALYPRWWIKLRMLRRAVARRL